MNQPDMQAAVAAAKEIVPRISPADAMALQAGSDALLVDVREANELAASGKAKGALHVPRAMVTDAADAASANHNPAFRPDRTIMLYCGSGARSALAGAALLERGFTDVRNVGGLQDWVAGGGAVEAA